MTEVTIHGQEFHLDGHPTYPGRTFEGHKIQGLLFNVRAVQATFDDANPETRRYWAYPDTGEWDPQRNVDEFCAALPTWKAHGVLGFTIYFQGGGALYVPEIYKSYDNNAFTPEGRLKPAYAGRMAQVLARADELGMVAIVGLFYCAHLPKMEGEPAMWRAGHEALSFLESAGRRNLLIEIANEADLCVRRSGYDVLRPERVHEMIEAYRHAHPAFLYSCSLGGANPETGAGMPPASLIEAADYVLLHGNGTRPPQLEAALQALQAMPAFRENPKPIVINEDSPAVPNLDAAWRKYASWGYYDQGFAGQAETEDPYTSYEDKPRWNAGPYEDLSGFQTPPVNWTINTRFKRDFFRRVAEVTGMRRTA